MQKDTDIANQHPGLSYDNWTSSFSLGKRCTTDVLWLPSPDLIINQLHVCPSSRQMSIRAINVQGWDMYHRSKREYFKLKTTFKSRDNAAQPVLSVTSCCRFNTRLLHFTSPSLGIRNVFISIKMARIVGHLLAEHATRGRAIFLISAYQIDAHDWPGADSQVSRM